METCVENNTFASMIQAILTGIIFMGAAFYLGRMVYRSFQAKHACSSGCAKCGATDLENVKKAIS